MVGPEKRAPRPGLNALRSCFAGKSALSNCANRAAQLTAFDLGFQFAESVLWIDRSIVDSRT